MWIILFGSITFAVAAFAYLGGERHDPPDEEDPPDDEEDDEEDEEDDDSAPPTTQDDSPYDDADVYYNVDAAKARKRKARVPQVKA